MEIPQLKLLASRVRGLLQQSSSTIGHSQALDLVAALPGLRNWPEVAAFPDRVAACELDAVSVGRLAFRLKKNFALELDAKDLLSALVPQNADAVQAALHVWPSGPSAGVYVTTSPEAIKALLARYEDATDGGLVYAESAGSHCDGSIDLGESGLWSSGIDRLSSGTLLVVGPIQLDQQSWNDAAGRLEMACLHALNSDHRVAVLFDTPTPEMLCEDLVVLLRSSENWPSGTDSALVGLVAENGELQRRRPFAATYPAPVATRSEVGLEALPASTRDALRCELAMCSSGIVLVGSSELGDSETYDQLSAGLALTDHLGAVARIMPRHRGTPAKDWLVPSTIKALPFLPSVESAYAQGYRRMVIDPNYTGADVLLKFDDVLFFARAYRHDVAGIALGTAFRTGGDELRVIERVIAVLGLFPVSGKHGRAVASDLFVRGTSQGPDGTDYHQIEEFLRAHRVVRWEEELGALLATGAITMAAAKKSAARDSKVLEFLAQQRTIKKAV